MNRRSFLRFLAALPVAGKAVAAAVAKMASAKPMAPDILPFITVKRVTHVTCDDYERALRKISDDRGDLIIDPLKVPFQMWPSGHTSSFPALKR